MSGPVEVTTRYATQVETLAEAWAFVMEHLDALGPDPEISIKPEWCISPLEMDANEDREWPRYFGVTVEGMVPQ